jgi:L-fucose isomerase-like protein
MKFYTCDDMKGIFESADARKAGKEAEALKRAALKVVEPTPREIADAMRFYPGVVSWLEREGANAITVDCFPGPLARKLPPNPCIAWSKLNDAGYYGVCKGDIQSTMTQMLITPYSGMPGFVTDPVFDTSRNEVIHAHCASATKMKGIHGPSSPFILRNHLETAEGAVMQVLVPANETITCARFVGAKKFLISTGEVTGNVDSDRGCRTQFRTRVADAQKMLENYSSGLHRVIFYGDHVRAAERMGKLMGFQVVREG